jgi:LSD1 subclass zinc finger protein
MPRNQVTCPECDALLSLGEAASPGKKIRCPNCQAVFTVPAMASAEVAAPRPRPDGPPRRRFKAKKQVMPVGALVAIVAGSALLIAGASVGAYLLFKKPGGGGVARGPDVVPASGVGTNIGQLAQEIEGEDIDGVPFKLSDYRGKVVVLDFWGHW